MLYKADITNRKLMLITLEALSSESDQHQISSCNISAL